MMINVSNIINIWRDKIVNERLLRHPKYSYFDVLSIDNIIINEVLEVLGLRGYSSKHFYSIVDSNKEIIFFLEDNEAFAADDLLELAKIMLVFKFIPDNKWLYSKLKIWKRTSLEENIAVAVTLYIEDTLIIAAVPFSSITSLPIQKTS